MNIDEEELDNILENFILEDLKEEENLSTCSLYSSEDCSYSSEEGYSSEEEDPLDNEIQRKHVIITELLFILLLTVCVGSGIFIFVNFLPVKFHERGFFWETFKNNCCSMFYNETRCELTFNCEISLQNWINIQNSTRKFLEECCYWFSPYFDLKWDPVLYCNPYCLR